MNQRKQVGRFLKAVTLVLLVAIQVQHASAQSITLNKDTSGTLSLKAKKKLYIIDTLYSCFEHAYVVEVQNESCGLFSFTVPKKAEARVKLYHAFKVKDTIYNPYDLPIYKKQVIGEKVTYTYVLKYKRPYTLAIDAKEPMVINYSLGHVKIKTNIYPWLGYEKKVRIKGDNGTYINYQTTYYKKYDWKLGWNLTGYADYLRPYDPKVDKNQANDTALFVCIRGTVMPLIISPYNKECGIYDTAFAVKLLKHNDLYRVENVYFDGDSINKDTKAALHYLIELLNQKSCKIDLLGIYDLKDYGFVHDEEKLKRIQKLLTKWTNIPTSVQIKELPKHIPKYYMDFYSPGALLVRYRN